MQASEHERWWVRPVCGALASQTGDFFTYPLDTAKIRLQISGEGGQLSRYLGLSHALGSVWKEEGAAGLYKGFSAALLRQGLYRGAVFMIYEPLRDACGSGPGAKILAGGLGGALGNAMTNPVDMAKVRMQADFSSSSRHVFHVLRGLFGEQGGRCLVQGVFPSMQRAFLVNAAELATYDSAKRKSSELMGEGLHSNFAAAFLAGFVAAAVSTPSDLIKTRLMNQPLDSRGRGSLYGNSFLRCLTVTVKAEGVLGLYKGFVPSWLRLGPYTVVSFLAFEKFREIVNLAGGERRTVD